MNNGISVKEYAKEQGISTQAVYKKIRKRKAELNGHILRVGGKTYLDETAQKILKPTGGNAYLIDKAKTAQKELKSTEEDMRDLYDELSMQKKETNRVYGELTSKVDKIKELKAVISEKDKTIEMLSDRLNLITDSLNQVQSDLERLSKNLDTLFAVFEDSKNAGLVRKIGNYISKG